MIQELDIVLATSGVTTIDVIEDELILHVKYDGNNNTYHNLHKIFLNYDFDIVSCQVWFEQIGQSETEAELILAGAIKTLIIAPNTKKTSITLAVDKTLIGAQRFFAEAISGDLSLQAIEDSFVTNEFFNETIEQIYNDLSLTAEKIVQNSINLDTSNSTIELTSNRASFYVQTNSIDYVINEIYTDWDLNQQPLTLIDKTTTALSASEIASLMDNYPRPDYFLKPYTNLRLQNLNFYVIRNFEGWYLNVTEFQLTAYQDRFGFTFDTSILTDEFVKITIQNLTVISGSPKANANTFPLQSGLTTTARDTIKYPYGAFKIWNNSNSSRNNIILTIPLTDVKVQSTKTENTLLNTEFWINNEGWYFGDFSDIDRLFAPMTKTYDVFSSSPVIDLEDGMNDTIVSFSFANIDPSRTALPPTFGSLNLNSSDLVDEIEFTLRLIISGVKTGTQFRVAQNSTTIFTYTTTNISSQPNIVDLMVKANSALIMITPIIKLENQNYYDWAFVPNASALSVSKIMKQPASVLTDAQYNAFNPDQPIVLNVNANSSNPILLKNLSFYTLRNSFNVNNVYTTTAYGNRVTINLDTALLSATEWTSLELNNIFYQQTYPVANNRMFPASTSSTNNYSSNTLSPTGNFSGRINIGNISNNYFKLSVQNATQVNINAKFWIKKNGINTLLYQGLKEEANNIIYTTNNAANNVFVVSIPQNNTSLENKIFYPIANSSLEYNWVNYNQLFRILVPYSFSPVVLPKYQFFIRLYCVYGRITGTALNDEKGMFYNGNTNTFEITINPSNAPQFRFMFNTASGTVTENFDVVLPKFPMNDLKVVDLIFEVDPSYFNNDDPIERRKRVTYLGQREIKL